jgi:ATP-dependent RNA helicase SUPV3L1/SUV3
MLNISRRGLLRRKVSQISGQRLLRTIDLSEPHLWYNDARKISRNVICHVGGTNSGKTYNALNALAAAGKGIYCGPLRLLAWEVQGSLLKKEVKCSLITGQEKDALDDGTHISCTVEMADLNKEFDVAVIDECQLFGDESRGWAWTQAFLGLKAKEIHLCGSVSMLPIVHNLCKLTNDTITVKTYSRLTPLTVCAKSLKSYKNIEAGDCVVGFGRKGLYETKREIEKLNPGLRCCVIYGGLPPDARKRQAELFSTPNSGYDVLVASDAIGMGLNLSIKRIIFSTVEKFDGRRRRRLLSAELKQIAGRAGRFGTIYEHGEVTCMNAEDLKYLRKGMQAIDKPIKKAGLFPSLEQLELLGVLIDYQVNDEILKAFWKDVMHKDWGTGDLLHNKEADTWLSAEEKSLRSVNLLYDH